MVVHNPSQRDYDMCEDVKLNETAAYAQYIKIYAAWNAHS